MVEVVRGAKIHPPRGSDRGDYGAHSVTGGNLDWKYPFVVEMSR